jgi:hypothetical protein
LEKCLGKQRQQQEQAVAYIRQGKRAAIPQQQYVAPQQNQPQQTNNGVSSRQGTGESSRPASSNIQQKNRAAQQRQAQNISRFNAQRAEYYRQVERERQVKKQQKAAEYRAEVEATNEVVNVALKEAIRRNKIEGDYLEYEQTGKKLGDQLEMITETSGMSKISDQSTVFECYLVDMRDSTRYYLTPKLIDQFNKTVDALGFVYAVKGFVGNEKQFYPFEQNDFDLFNQEQAYDKFEELSRKENEKYGKELKIVGYVSTPANPSGNFDDGSIQQGVDAALSESVKNSRLEIEANYYKVTWEVTPLKLEQVPLISTGNAALDIKVKQIGNDKPNVTQKGKLQTTPDKNRYGQGETPKQQPKTEEKPQEQHTLEVEKTDEAGVYK